MKIRRKSGGTRSALKRLRDMRPGSIDAATRKFLWTVAKSMQEEISGSGVPEEVIPYKIGLKVIGLGQPPNYKGISLILPSTPKLLIPSEMTRTLVYVRQRGGGRDVEALERLSPWPASRLPLFPDGQDATLVTRAVREYEFLWRLSELEPGGKDHADLEASGLSLRSPPWERYPGPILEDYGWRALRIEFGRDPDMTMPHWRPAIAEHVSPKKEAEEFGKWMLGANPRYTNIRIPSAPPGFREEDIEFFQKVLDGVNVLMS